MGLVKQLMIFGELWTVGASHAGDSFSLSLWPTRGYGGPPIHNMGAPIPENISGRKLTQVLNSVGSVLVHQETVDWGGV